jgi:hypothetical protein
MQDRTLPSSFFVCHIARLSVWLSQADSFEIHRFHPLNIPLRLGTAPQMKSS